MAKILTYKTYGKSRPNKLPKLNKVLQKQCKQVIKENTLTIENLQYQCKLMSDKINIYADDVKCKRCLITYFFNGCPHCGNTFLKREILHQTF